MRQWVAPKATLSPSAKRVNERWRAGKEDAGNDCLKFPPIGPSEEYVEPKPPGLSEQIFGDGAEKFVAEMMVVDVDQIVVDQHSSSPSLSPTTS
jgi:hypothetical protein